MKQAVITGGGGCLGKAIAGIFTDLSWTVEAPGREALDVADGVAIRRYFESRRVDLLVCTAGIIRDAPLAKMEESAWNEVIAVNYQGAADCAAAVLPGMARRGAGHVVFISSHAANHPATGQAAYAAAKAALLGLAASLARRHGPQGIRVNALLPGFLETTMTASVTARRKAAILDDHALARFNTPEQVARFIRHLHEELPHTSGQVFQLDSRVP